jgi:hypothetical protein
MNNENLWEYLISQVTAKKQSRKWSDLPFDFEIKAVQLLANQFNGFFKGLIAGRIAVSKAMTFDALESAIRKAQKEDNKRLNENENIYKSITRSEVKD